MRRLAFAATALGVAVMAFVLYARLGGSSVRTARGAGGAPIGATIKVRTLARLPCTTSGARPRSTRTIWCANAVANRSARRGFTYVNMRVRMMRIFRLMK